MSANITLLKQGMQNPMLIGQGFPPFDAIAPEHVVPGMTQLLGELEQALTELEATVAPTWGGLATPLNQMEERLRWSWGVVGHLMGVKNCPELRQAYQAVQPQVVKFANRLGQSKPIYNAFKQVRASQTWHTLEPRSAANCGIRHSGCRVVRSGVGGGKSGEI